MTKKVTIQIKSFGGSVLFKYSAKDNTIKQTLEKAVAKGANLGGADLRDANLRDANLRGADLRDAYLRDAYLRGAKNIPQSYINSCSRDMLFVFEHLKAELPFLRDKLVEGEVDGTQYEGECACLIGTLANADGGLDKVCSMIPFYEKGLDNPGEQWFWQIRMGDTPKTSFFAKHAVELIDSVLGKPKRWRPKSSKNKKKKV